MIGIVIVVGVLCFVIGFAAGEQVYKRRIRMYLDSLACQSEAARRKLQTVFQTDDHEKLKRRDMIDLRANSQGNSSPGAG